MHTSYMAVWHNSKSANNVSCEFNSSRW